LRDPTFTQFDTVPAFDRRTDRQTHDDSIYSASIVSRGKNNGHQHRRYSVHVTLIYTNVPHTANTHRETNRQTDRQRKKERECMVPVNVSLWKQCMEKVRL